MHAELELAKAASAALTPASALDGFRVEIDPARERADIVLCRPPFNVISMPQREQLRITFEALDANEDVRVIVLRADGEHFSSGGNIKGFLEATPEHVSKLAWNVAAPARCSKPVIAAAAATASASASSCRWPATSAWSRRPRCMHCPSRSWARFPAPADRPGCRRWWASRAPRTS
jgi:hypothetical protein